MIQMLNVPFGRATNGKFTLWPRVRERPRRRYITGEPELWEETAEAYDGAGVLGDLLSTVDDEDAALRIVARFAAVRLALLASEGSRTRAEIEEERGIARTYVDALPPGDRERRVLARMVAQTTGRLRRAVAACALEAAEVAEDAGHPCGAYRLNYLAWMLGMTHGWREPSAQAARAIERAAAAGGGQRSERLWRRRATALEKIEE